MSGWNERWEVNRQQRWRSEVASEKQSSKEARASQRKQLRKEGQVWDYLNTPPQVCWSDGSDERRNARGERGGKAELTVLTLQRPNAPPLVEDEDDVAESNHRR